MTHAATAVPKVPGVLTTDHPDDTDQGAEGFRVASPSVSSVRSCMRRKGSARTSGCFFDRACRPGSYRLPGIENFTVVSDADSALAAGLTAVGAGGGGGVVLRGAGSTGESAVA